MSAIEKALTDIKYTIPLDILKAAFKDENALSLNRIPRSVDDVIKEKVLAPRVLMDCNLIAGQIAVIDLTGCLEYSPQPYQFVFQVPMSRSQNRRIMSVLSVSYLPYVSSYYNGNNYNLNNNNEIAHLGERIYASHASVPQISTARVELIGPNTLLITDNNIISPTYAVRAILENDANLNNLKPRIWIAFAELCIAAVKSYIYNKLIVLIGDTYLQGGQELGVFKDIIDEYKDAEEEYKTLLKEKWGRLAIMNDTPQAIKFLKLQISPGL